MAQAVYRGMLGWSEADERHPGTHIILTNEEYEKITKERDEAIRDKVATGQAYRVEIDGIKQDAEEERQEAKQKAEAQYNELKGMLAYAEAEKEYQTNLNTNLIRICKERANADRKLKPKKEHTGYVVISSQEKEIRYKKDKNLFTDVVWETVLQSPYSIEFTEEDVRKLIFDELLTQEGGWKLAEIGITSRYLISYDELVQNLGNKIKEQNRAFNQRLRANYKAGYWEYIILHTLPLGPVPKNMLP